MSTEKRKREHLDLCLSQDVRSRGGAGWDKIRLPHRALPEIDFAAVSVEAEFLNKKFSAPFLISSMTGGSEKGDKINLALAALAEKKNIPMGVGSQRVALEEKKKENVFSKIRKNSPKATLYANIGLVQFNYGVGVEDCEWLVDSIEAEALILHLNPLQEALQKEGNRNFSNLLSKISQLKKNIKVPLIVKETGCGLDLQSAELALEAGADALDVAGLGGTHWGYIEGLRAESTLGEIFRDWGLTSVEALLTLRERFKKLPLIASGGILTGLDAAKAIALGAQFTGMAMAFLRAAEAGVLEDFFETQVHALKTALFCTGSRNLMELQEIKKASPFK